MLQANKQSITSIKIAKRVHINLSKAARGRPEGPTERRVFKIFFVMWANFDRIGQQKNGQKTETNRWQ